MIMNIAAQPSFEGNSTAISAGLIAGNATNCYTVTAPGRLCEAIEVTANHHASRNAIALLLGEGSYVARDRFGGEGAEILNLKEGDGYIRHASVYWRQITSGKTIPLLRKITALPKTYLFHVCFGMIEGSALRRDLEPLYSGVVGGYRIARGGSEELIELEAGKSILVFYPDGRVVEITTDDKVVVRSLAPEECLEARIDQIEGLCADAFGDIPKIDKAGHLAASLFRNICILSPSNKGRMLRMMEAFPSMHTGVRKHFGTVLGAIGDPTFYGWMVAVDDKAYAGDSAIRSPKSTPDHKRKQAKAKKAVRANENRMHAKGPSPSANNSGKGNKGEKGSKKKK